MSDQNNSNAVRQKLDDVRRSVVVLVAHLVQHPEALGTVEQAELAGVAMLTAAVTNALQAATGGAVGGHDA
ncbi:hypothetical protein ACWA7J_21700 [Leptothrix sp. BB-4]